MANQNTAAKIFEGKSLEQKNELTIIEAKAATANYLERAKEMNMPVLRVTDLLTDENEPKKNEVLEQTTEIEPQKTETDTAKNEISIIALGEPAKEEALELTELRIDNNSKSQAFRIVDKMMDEAHKLWTSKRKIRSNILEVNHHSAYSFIGYMITTSESGTVLSDIRKYITYNEVCHIITCLLRQAKNSGLVDLTQFRTLRREQSIILKKYSHSFSGRLNKNDIEHLNLLIEEMYQEMTKVAC